MIYLVRQVDWDSCTHEALVDGPDMSPKEAKARFAALLEQFDKDRDAADKVFVDAYGSYDKPLQGLEQGLYHSKRCDEFRRAGCWKFEEFLEGHGFKTLEYEDVSINRRCDAES